MNYYIIILIKWSRSNRVALYD